MHKGLKFTEKLNYLAWCWITLGVWWGIKILIKAAILEAMKGDWEKEN